MRVAILRRPAFEDIRHEHVLAIEVDLGQQLVEQLAGLADEREPHPVLVGARRLADEHQIGVGVAGPEHDRGARLVQGAARAPPRLLVDGLQQLATLRGSPHWLAMVTAQTDGAGGYPRYLRGSKPGRTTAHVINRTRNRRPAGGILISEAVTRIARMDLEADLSSSHADRYLDAGTGTGLHLRHPFM